MRPKSTFNPERGRNQLLDNCVDLLNNYPLPKRDHQSFNLNIAERKALDSLKNDNSIVIMEADKGSAFIVMDKNYYVSKMDDMLQDVDTYKMLKSYEQIETIKKVNKFCEKYKSCLTEKEIKYIRDFDPKSGYFYGLAKIHKCKPIIDIIEKEQSEYITMNAPQDLCFRPIIASSNSATSKLSALIDTLLKPCLEHMPSYIRDTTDFIGKISKYVTDTESTLITHDVVSLYTNIPHSTGKTAIAFWVDKCRELIPRRFHKNLILEAISIVLNNNIFKFNDK